MTNIIEIRDVILEFNNKRIFNKLSLDIASGDFVTVMGSNGSGKSRLAHILYGILPYLGSVKLAGKPITKDNAEEIRKNLSVVFEDSSNLFVTDNVLDELNCGSVSKKDVDDIIKKLDIAHLLSRNPNTLSSGESQLISLACALVSRPLVLVLDEALNALDNFNKKRVMKVLNQYNKKGLTIINITQNSEDILCGNRVVVFDNGTVVLNEPLKKALEQEKVFTSAHIALPFMADLCTKLKYYNLVSKIELDKVRLVNSIWE